ncbi:lysophospholipid acyltransferase family protein [Piscicoccus intestinalis]|uniref:lysophospholipid acyltransferase family protein n=1 Tax=Piscicoccus intestinalis TaxID=746033 RepID=UPI000A01D56F|nr:lysophospholipid acyltransferase family protein [Piscicoccus intestinalis]
MSTDRESAQAQAELAQRLEQGVETLIAALRWAVRAAGGDLTEREVEQRVAALLAYLRRRLAGELEVDAYGFDEDFTEHIYLPVLRVLYRRWFRVEVRGIENIPDDGAALIVANHSGTLPIDCLMTQVAVHDTHPRGRHLRLLGADLLFRLPVFGETARAGGTTLAAPSDAQRLLAAGELVAVWPEGFKGLGKPFADRYRLQRFGRGGFVGTALRTRAPIVPCAIVGAEEIYPKIGDLTALAHLLDVPYFPVTPTFPHLGLLGLVPLPSRWIIDFSPPVEVADLGAEAAEDSLLVFELTDRVRETIQSRLHVLLADRGSAF